MIQVLFCVAASTSSLQRGRQDMKVFHVQMRQPTHVMVQGSSDLMHRRQKAPCADGRCTKAVLVLIFLSFVQSGMCTFVFHVVVLVIPTCSISTVNENISFWCLW